jgi:predicted DNA-binding transcriptional regulator YafY
MHRALGRAARLQRLEELLLSNPAGYSVAELVSRTGVDRSTIYRDIALMSDNGIPIQQDGSLYSIDRTQYLSSVRLSSGESLMLYLAMRQAVRRLTHIPPMMISVLEKLIIAIRDEQLGEQLTRSLQAMQEQRPPTSERALVWDALVRGWREQITVRILHQKFDSNQANEYEIQPWFFEPAVLSEGVYVIGHSIQHAMLRTFKVERIVKATLTTQRFDRPDTIDLESLLRHAWGVWYGADPVEVRLRFYGTAANRVRETIWHPLQQIIELPDGNLEWRVQIAGVLELIPWIRGWGPGCEVLAPADLRDLIAADMRRAADLYRE